MSVRHYYDGVNPQPHNRGPLRRLCDGYHRTGWGDLCMFRPYREVDGKDYCRIHDPSPDAVARREAQYARRRRLRWPTSS